MAWPRSGKVLAVDLDIKEQISHEGQLGEDEGNSDENEDDSFNGWTEVHPELADEERTSVGQGQLSNYVISLINSFLSFVKLPSELINSHSSSTVHPPR